MIEEQIMQQNTWADPQDKYRPVHPESYGPDLAQVVRPAPRWPIFTPTRPMADPSIMAARRPQARTSGYAAGGSGVSAVAAGAQRYLGDALLRLRAAADRSREDLDQSARLHLQANLCLTAHGKRSTRASGRCRGSASASARPGFACPRPLPRRPSDLLSAPRQDRRCRHRLASMPSGGRGPIRSRHGRIRRPQDRRSDRQFEACEKKNPRPPLDGCRNHGRIDFRKCKAPVCMPWKST